MPLVRQMEKEKKRQSIRLLSLATVPKVSLVPQVYQRVNKR